MDRKQKYGQKAKVLIESKNMNGKQKYGQKAKVLID